MLYEKYGVFFDNKIKKNKKKMLNKNFLCKDFHLLLAYVINSRLLFLQTYIYIYF